MNADAFLDTNILVYAVACDESARHKKDRALELINSQVFALSAQVLQEFYVTVTRKLEIPLAPAQALEWIDQFSTFPCVPLDAYLVKTGVEISTRYQVSYWDGAIIAAAETADAATLYSEDLSHGQKYGTVTVVNPFIDE